jgi:hypothetical protein
MDEENGTGPLCSTIGISGMRHVPAVEINPPSPKAKNTVKHSLFNVFFAAKNGPSTAISRDEKNSSWIFRKSKRVRLKD